MANSKYAGVLKVISELKKGGYWVVTSKDLPGLLLSGRDLPELTRDTPNAIKLLYKLNYGMTVVVRAVTEDPKLVGHTDGAVPANWVAFPKEECQTNGDAAIQ